ncbi:MAG: hypothetical protein JWO84_5 [Parcubacteria group bacterium]|nr:hypothetical protein [Parcubacteria group bacterium]
MSDVITRDPLRRRTTFMLPGFEECSFTDDFAEASGRPSVFNAPITSSTAVFDNAYSRINGGAGLQMAHLYHYHDRESNDEVLASRFGGQRGLRFHIGHVFKALAWFASPDGAGDLPLAARGDDIRLIAFAPTCLGELKKIVPVWDRDARGFRLHLLKWNQPMTAAGLSAWSKRTYVLSSRAASAIGSI